MRKSKRQRTEQGIYQKLQFLNLMQIPFHMVNFSLINSIALKEDHPLHHLMASDSFLWCPNLAASDPTFILPIAASSLMFLNLSMMLKQGPDDPPLPFGEYGIYMKWVPLLSIPIQMQFCSGFNLYTVIVAINQVGIIAFTKNPTVMRYYECDTKTVLEKLNKGRSTENNSKEKTMNIVEEPIQKNYSFPKSQA